jgi:hypothetical protein
VAQPHAAQSCNLLPIEKSLKRNRLEAYSTCAQLRSERQFSHRKQFVHPTTIKIRGCGNTSFAVSKSGFSNRDDSDENRQQTLLIRYREAIHPVALEARGHRIRTDPETVPEPLLLKPKSSSHQNRIRCDHGSTPGSSDLPPV